MHAAPLSPRPRRSSKASSHTLGYRASLACTGVSSKRATQSRDARKRQRLRSRLGRLILAGLRCSIRGLALPDAARRRRSGESFEQLAPHPSRALVVARPVQVLRHKLQALLLEGTPIAATLHFVD